MFLVLYNIHKFYKKYGIVNYSWNQHKKSIEVIYEILNVFNLIIIFVRGKCWHEYFISKGTKYGILYILPNHPSCQWKTNIPPCTYDLGKCYEELHGLQFQKYQIDQNNFSHHFSHNSVYHHSFNFKVLLYGPNLHLVLPPL